MESNTNEKAEQKKNLGNQEFKKGNFSAAVSYYTEAIETEPHEAIYSNRAASLIALKQYKQALEDCQAAQRMNPDFARLYKRLFKANLALGNIGEAEEALKIAVEKEPNDKSNKADLELMETVKHQMAMILKYGVSLEESDMYDCSNEDTDFEKAVGYCTSILKNCPASIRLNCLKVKMLLLASKSKEAADFTKELIENPLTSSSPEVYAWRGKALIYSGADVIGKKFLQDAIRQDPDNKEAQKALKMIKAAQAKKEEAGELFKAEKLDDAIAKFDECVRLDPLNLNYNATILLNKSIALTKQKKYEEAIKAVDKAIKA